MKFLFLLVGVAYASIHSLHNPLVLHKEYRFRYDASLESGIPHPETEATITRIRADVFLQRPSDDVALLRLVNIELASEKDVVTPDFNPFESLQKREVFDEHHRLLGLPLRFQYRHGIVSDIEFSPEDLHWSKNFKRSIVNLLQVNLLSHNLENEFFVATEKTIEGECEVAYTVAREKENTVISKSVNFEKCEQRPDNAYNQRFASECPECDYKMVLPQTVYNYRFDNEKLKDVDVHSTYTVSLKEQALMKTVTRARLSFIETAGIRSELEVPSGEFEDLMYSNEWEQGAEEFFMKGDEVRPHPFHWYKRKVELIDDMMQRLAELKENTPESAHMFARLVHALRKCTLEELDGVHETVWKKAERREKAIIDHALAVSGTKNTIEHLFRHAENISPFKFAELLKSVQETTFPSDTIAELLYNLTKTEKYRDEPVVRQSVWLAYGAIVRAVASSTLDKPITKSPYYMKEKYVSIMKKNWDDAVTIYEKILALKTFANAGLDISIGEIEKIVLDKKEPRAVRKEAIDSLRLLSDQIPRRIQKILMPIYTNRLEQDELRMASLVQLMQAKPEYPLLLSIVNRMEREPNQHVAAFTFTLLKTYSESTLPSFHNVSSVLTSIMRVSQFRPKESVLSSYRHRSLFSYHSFSGLGFNLGTIFGKNSPIPKDVSLSLETVFGGNWNKLLAQVGFSHQNVEHLFNVVLTKLRELQKKTSESSTFFSRISDVISALTEIGRTLNLRIRKNGSEEGYAMLYVRYKQMDYAVLPVDEDILDSLISDYIHDGRINVKLFERLFNKNFEFDFAHAGFLFESLLKVPTTVGMHLTIITRQPTIFSGSGRISFETTSHGVRARLQAQPSLASTHLQVMTIITPLLEHGAKTVRSAQILIPIDVEAEITTKKRIEIVFRQNLPEVNRTLVRFTARPIAFWRFRNKKTKGYNGAEEKTITLPRYNEIVEEHTLKIDWAGVQFALTGNKYSQWSLENVLLGEQNVELTVHPGSHTVKQISLRIVIHPSHQSIMEQPEIQKIQDVNKDEERYFHKLIRKMDLSSAFTRRIDFFFQAEETSELSILSECEAMHSFCRLTSEMRTPGLQEWKLTNRIELLLSRYDIQGQIQPRIYLYSDTLWGSETKNHVEIAARAESEEYINHTKETHGLFTLLKRVLNLKQLNSVVNYDVSSKIETFFERVVDVLHGKIFWNSQLQYSKNETRRTVLQLSPSSDFSHSFNLMLQTPGQILRVHNILWPLTSYPITIPQSSEAYTEIPLETNKENDNFGEENAIIDMEKSTEGDEENVYNGPEIKTHVQEFDHRICFSLEKVPACPNQQVSGNTIERTVPFGCLPRHNSSTRRLLKAMRNGDELPLQQIDLKLSYVDKILVPQSCNQI